MRISSVLALCACLSVAACSKDDPISNPTNPSFSLTSTAEGFKDGGKIGPKQICKRTDWAAKAGFTPDNKSPQLSWEKPPAGTTYYALILLDTYNSSGSPVEFLHWGVVNIPVATTTLTEGADDETSGGKLTASYVVLTHGVGGADPNSTPDTRYFGPCVPNGAGQHTYTMRLIALEGRLSVSAGAMYSAFKSALSSATTGNGKELGGVEITATLEWSDY